MTYDELKAAHAAGAWIYGIEDDGKLHRIEDPQWSCPADRYVALVPYIAELGQEVGAVAWGVMYPPNHPQAGQIWTTFVGRSEAVEGKDACWNAGDDLIVPLYTSPAHTSEARDALKDEDVEWVVNDLAELGVKIGSQFFFCYKGHSLSYEDATHEDDGRRMKWRHVFKREFGECVHPVNYEDLRKCGHKHFIGTVSLDDSEDWQDLPDAAMRQEGGE